MCVLQFAEAVFEALLARRLQLSADMTPSQRLELRRNADAVDLFDKRRTNRVGFAPVAWLIVASILPNASEAQAPAHLYSSLPTPEQVTACYESVCGPEAQRLNMQNGLARRTVEDRESLLLWNQIRPRVESALFTTRARRAHWATIALNAIRAGRPLTMSHDQLEGFRVLNGVLNAASAYGQYAEAWVRRGGAEQDRYDVRPEAPFYAAAQSEHRAIFIFITDLDKLVADEERFFAMTGSVYKARLLSRTRSTSAATAVRDANNLLQRVGRYSPRYLSPLFLSLSVPMRAIEKAARGESLTLHDEREYVAAARAIELFGYVMDLEERRHSALAFSHDLSFYARDPQTLTYIERLRNAGTDPSYPANTSTLLASCRAKILSLGASTVSELVRDRARASVAPIKAAAIRVLPKWFAAEDAEAIGHAIDRALVQLPPDANEHLVAFRQELASEEEREARLLSLSSVEAADVFASLALLSISNPSPSQAENLGGLCTDSWFPAEANVFYTPLPNETHDRLEIGLSWWHLASPRGLAWILGHEIGHLVSHIFFERTQRLSAQAAGDVIMRNPRFISARECLGSRNPFHVTRVDSGVARASSRAPLVVERAPFLEEDWADRFGSELLRELERSGGFGQGGRAENRACGYGREPGVASWSRQHSAAVLRLVFGELDAGRSLTPECAPITSYAAPHSRALRCE